MTENGKIENEGANSEDKNEEIKTIKYGISVEEMIEKGKFANKIIDYNEARTLEFTGKIDFLPKDIKGFEQDNYQFELNYDYFNGEKMIFEVSSNSPAAKQIIERLNQGIRKMTIARFPGGLGKGYFKVLTSSLNGVMIGTGKIENMPKSEKTSRKDPEGLRQVVELTLERIKAMSDNEYTWLISTENQGLPRSVRYQLEHKLKDPVPGYILKFKEEKNILFITKVKK